MTPAFNQYHVRKTIPGIFLACALIGALAVAPSVRASSRAAAAVTTTTIAYRLSGQLGSAALAGWLSGTLDSTGIVTATVTTGNATTNAPVTENVSGRIVGSGSSAMVLLAVTPMAGSRGAKWAMVGGVTGTAGQWSGTITQGSAYAGLWTLTPQTSHVNIDFGGKSAATSKDKVAVSGLISAGVTAGGWADGTYSSFDGSVVTVIHGWVNSGGDISFTIPWGKSGTVVLVGTAGKLRITHPSWSGSFIGPGVGDLGTWIAQS